MKALATSIAGIALAMAPWPGEPQDGGDGSARAPAERDAAPLCDGTPPELENKDATAYDYELVCGKKREKKTIEAGAKQELEGFSGCNLLLGENEPTVLHTEMVCTVEGGKLVCDLL